MEPFHKRGRVRIGHGLGPLRKRGSVDAVQLLREFPDALEGRSVDRGPNVFDLPFLEPDFVRAFPAIGIAGGIVDLHLIKTWRQCRNIGQAVEDGPMLQFCDRSRNKNSEMPDVGIEEINNSLASPLQVLCILVDDWY